MSTPPPTTLPAASHDHQDDQPPNDLVDVAVHQEERKDGGLKSHMIRIPIPEITNVEQVTKWMGENMLLVLTIGGVLIGCFLGFLGRLANFSDGTILLVSFPGEILMRLLKMFILPLIISSLIAGMAQLDARSSGRMGMRALVYYLTTTVLAAIVGIILVLLIHPGDPLIKAHVESKPDDTKVSTLDAILDIVSGGAAQAKYSHGSLKVDHGERSLCQALCIPTASTLGLLTRLYFRCPPPL